VSVGVVWGGIMVVLSRMLLGQAAVTNENVRQEEDKNTGRTLHKH
jgi:hypothetical protein